MKTLFLIFLMAIQFSAHAEIYRWTDKNGKVHYTDKKPAEKAEDISASVKQQNIDTSNKEHQKLEKIFRKENEADREYKRQNAQPSSKNIIICKNAREYLTNISGRVEFIDENGNAVKVTEAERINRVKETQQYINENCAD